jgi:hypothetical protein
MHGIGEPPDTDAGCDASTLLSLWERGVSHADFDRGDALIEALDTSEATPRTLGERTIRLLHLHARLFGPRVDLLSHCPSCGTDAQFSADCAGLAGQLPVPESTAPHHVDVDGLAVAFRLPTRADVASAAGEPTDDAFARRVLERCVVGCTRDGATVPSGEWPPSMLDALSARIEALDPGASVAFAVSCPECASTWRAPLDCGQLVWQKVQRAAERLLLDIDTLARAYGWTESDVLRLTPIRRAAYVQMTTS